MLLTNSLMLILLLSDNYEIDYLYCFIVIERKSLQKYRYDVLYQI